MRGTLSIITLTQLTGNSIATVSKLAGAFEASLRTQTFGICITSTGLVTLLNVIANITFKTLVTLADVASFVIFTGRLIGADTSVATFVNIDTVRFIDTQFPVNFCKRSIPISTTTTVATQRIHAMDIIMTKSVVLLALISVYAVSSDD